VREVAGDEVSAGRIVETRRVPRAQVSEYAETIPMGLYAPIVIADADREAVARLCARRDGADSEVAQMLGVAGVLS